ncbi:MAG: DEAD/DEAH box helicase family protein [Chloroflexota bacterium]
MADLRLFQEAIAEIAARLDLREPNTEAVQSLAAEVSQHYDVDEREPPFECVVDSATGVGKTYILAGAMELFASAYGVRDFAIITPGRTILEKTRDNLTPGHRKSLLGPMSFTPVVVTADNFATPVMRAAMDDPTQVKVYLFTVQSLIKPEAKTGRRTREFQEGLGTELYGHLQSVADLVVFADEHHCYYGPAFSNAVRELHPWVLVGLTATPDKKTPKDQVIFRYPLAAAIADRLVKTPVIVGRKDDRRDPLTKLTDGVVLLNAKRDALAAYAQATGQPMVNPVMLVVAKDIADADEYGTILRSPDFFAGEFADGEDGKPVLVVHSKAADEALAALATVEDPDSPVRLIISVGMLKEGWDVRNVYVIASMRSSVSEILTEQTLGRGMRLPFGAYTGIEILDTLEVVAHERYEELLRRAGVLNEAFVDFRTRAAVRLNAQGQQVVVKETIQAQSQPLIATGSGTDVAAPAVADDQPDPVVTTVEDRTNQVGAAALAIRQQILPRADAPRIVIPILRMSTIESSFSLADITDTSKFRRLGESLAANPEAELARTVVGARVVTGPDGMKRTELVTSAAVDRVVTQQSLFDGDELRTRLSEVVLASPSVPARRDQRAALAPILDSFLDGLGPKGPDILSANLDRAGARLVRLVAEEQRAYMAKPWFEEVVELRDFAPVRASDRVVSGDRFGAFGRSSAYDGWKRSLFPVEWFDSRPERTAANILDEADEVTCWLRLHTGDLPILWNGFGQQYNPDFIVIEGDGRHWVIEIKMDKEMASPDVVGKREAAQRWANHVNADERVEAKWGYLLLSESDVEMSRGSWGALKAVGGDRS